MLGDILAASQQLRPPFCAGGTLGPLAVRLALAGAGEAAAEARVVEFPGCGAEGERDLEALLALCAPATFGKGKKTGARTPTQRSAHPAPAHSPPVPTSLPWPHPLAVRDESYRSALALPADRIYTQHFEAAHLSSVLAAVGRVLLPRQGRCPPGCTPSTSTAPVGSPWLCCLAGLPAACWTAALSGMGHGGMEQALDVRALAPQRLRSLPLLQAASSSPTATRPAATQALWPPSWSASPWATLAARCASSTAARAPSMSLGPGRRRGRCSGLLSSRMCCMRCWLSPRARAWHWPTSSLPAQVGLGLAGAGRRGSSAHACKAGIGCRGGAFPPPHGAPHSALPACPALAAAVPAPRLLVPAPGCRDGQRLAPAAQGAAWHRRPAAARAACCAGQQGLPGEWRQDRVCLPARLPRIPGGWRERAGAAAGGGQSTLAAGGRRIPGLYSLFSAALLCHRVLPARRRHRPTAVCQLLRLCAACAAVGGAENDEGR